MGQRISFFRNNFSYDLKSLLKVNYEDFKQEYLKYEKDSLQEFNEPFGNEELKKFLIKNCELPDFNILDKKIIDELTAEFIGFYCDLFDKNANILDFFGPCMNKKNYHRSNELILKTKDKRLIKLWNYLIKGRSLKDYNEFKSYTNDYQIGFLCKKEIEELKNKITQYFGDKKQIREKYWTEKEKEFEIAQLKSKDGSFSLFDHHPKSAGIEYILQAIDEMTNRNDELITGIE